MQISIEYSYTITTQQKVLENLVKNSWTRIPSYKMRPQITALLDLFLHVTSRIWVPGEACAKHKKNFFITVHSKTRSLSRERAVICNFFFGRKKKVESEATFGCFLAFPSKLSLLHNLQDDLERRMEGTRKPYRRSA